MIRVLYGEVEAFRSENHEQGTAKEVRPRMSELMASPSMWSPCVCTWAFRCRPLIPEFAVILSYGVAIAYVTADAVAKGYSCAKESGSG